MQTDQPFQKEVIERAPLQEVSLDQIKIRSGWNIRRDIDPNKVDEISKSMSIVGLLKPILLNAKYEIIAGERRYHAAKKLAWSKIAARIVNFENPNHEKLAHLDENLEHKTLAAGDHAQAISQRKAVWESLFPETKQGVAGGLGKARKLNEDPASGKLSSATQAEAKPKASEEKPKSFAKQEAEKAGVDKRTIERKAKIGAKGSANLVKALNENKITSEVASKLTAESHKVQDKVIELLLSEKYNGSKHTTDLIKALIEKAKGNEEMDLIEDKKWGSISRERWLKKFSDLSHELQLQFPTLISENLLGLVENAELTAKVKSQITEIYFVILKNSASFGLQNSTYGSGKDEQP